MRRDHEHPRDGAVLAKVAVLPLLLIVALICMWGQRGWGQRGPNPDHAFAAIVTYFALIVLWITGDLLWRLWNRPLARPSVPPPPPSAPSPVGVPVGPRSPAPLVAHARAPERERADA